MSTDSATAIRRDRLARWAALAVLVLLAVGLGAPLLSQLLQPPDALEEPPLAPTALPTASVSNFNTRLEWATGIQTWRHWYVGGSDEHLANLHRQGFAWVKQRFAWADMQPVKGSDIKFAQADLFFNGVKGAGPDFKVLIQLDVPPEWAKTNDQPPFDFSAFAEFAGAFAEHFAGRVHAYEIMNEPNLASAWGAEPLPKAYVEVLEASYAAIKAADPNALVVSAGLSPTADDFPNAMGDEAYLRELYEMAGGATGVEEIGLFDAVGAHAPGFKAAPEVAPEDAAADAALGGQRYFTFRRLEDLRAVMEEFGDNERRIVVTEFGWTIDPRPESPYSWSAVSNAERSDFTRRAYQYAADNWAAWIGPLFLFTAPDPAWGPDHEAYWRAITDQRGWLLDGLSLANLGPGTEARVEVPQDVEEARQFRTDERIPLQPLTAQDMPAMGTVFGTALAEATHGVGGAIVASARDDERLALATGSSVVLYDLYDLSADDMVGELARTGALAQAPGALAIDGDLMAVGLDGDEPSVTLFSAPRTGDASAGRDPDGKPAELTAVATIKLPTRPQNTVWIGGGAPRMRLQGRELLAAQAYCAVSSPSPDAPDGLTDDCTLVLHRVTDVTQPSPPQEILRTPASLPDPWPAWGADGAMFVADGATMVAYGPGQEMLEEAGAIDLGAQIWWMGAAGGNVAVLAQGTASGPDSALPAMLHMIDVAVPAHPKLLSSTAVDGNGAIRDGKLVTVLLSYCGFPDLEWRGWGLAGWSSYSACSQAQAVIDVTEPESPVRVAFTWNEELGFPVAVEQGRMLTAGPLGLTIRTLSQTNGFGDPAFVKTAEPHAVDLIGALGPGQVAVVGPDGLAVVDATDGRLVSANTLHVAEFPDCAASELTFPRDLAVSGSMVYVVNDRGDLSVYDAAGATPRPMGCAFVDLNAIRVAAEGNHAFVAGSPTSGESAIGLVVIDVAAPERPATVGAVTAEQSLLPSGEPSLPVDIAVAGGRAYVATGYEILVFDVTEPEAPRHLGSLATPGAALVALQNRLYVAVPCSAPSAEGAPPCTGGLRIFDTSGSGLPSDVGALGSAAGFTTLSVPFTTSVSGGTEALWVASPDAVWLVDIADPTRPTVIDGFPATATGLVINDGRLVVAEGVHGMTIVDAAALMTKAD